MIRSILKFLGWEIYYTDHRFGDEFTHRYSRTDYAMERPIHEDMSVAYPDGMLHFRKIK